MDKTERLINLIALLLSARRALTASEIREKIPGYGDQSDETFHRMFERDKVDMRDLGFTLVQQESVLGTEPAYRIDREEALLDDPGLTPAEQAALSLAAQAWGGVDGSLGVLKLAIVAGAVESAPAGWLLPRVDVDRNVTALFDAVSRRKRVRFSYRTGGGGEPKERSVDPWGLYHRGDWYLTGFDHGAGDVRHFKLSRVAGRVAVAGGASADFDPPPKAELAVRRGPWEGEPDTQASIAFAPEAAWWAERRTGARSTEVREDGWVVVAVPVADRAQFAGWVAGFGARAVVLEPEDIRLAVRDHLRRALEATG